MERDEITKKLEKASELKFQANELLDEVYEVAMKEIEPLVKKKQFQAAYTTLMNYFFGAHSECMQKFDIISFIFDAEEKVKEKKKKK